MKETSQRIGGWRRGIAALLFVCAVLVLSPKSARAQTVLLGDQAVENQVDMNVKGQAEAFQSTATTTGQLTYINIYLDSTSTASQIVVGIYADNSGHPGALLTQGTSNTQLVAGSWSAVAVTSATITSGVHYWITILGIQSGVPHFRDTTGTGCKSETSSQTTLTTLPSSWTTGTVYGTCPISAYGLNGPPMGTSVLIGEFAVENYVDTNPVGRAEAFQATANASGTVTAINLYLDSTNLAPSVYVGLYADSSGNPGTLLGQGNTTHPVAGTWNQITISSAAITAGKPYWIAVLGPSSGAIKFRDRASGPCHSQTTASTTLTSLPTSWVTGTVYPTCPLSAYGVSSASTLVVTPSSLNFTAPQGGANPSPASLSAATSGTGTPAFTASSDSSWLTVSPTSGSLPKVLQVSATVGSLTAGTYTGHITVTSSGLTGSPTVIPVTFCVTGGSGPSITSLTPATGPVGTSVTIAGKNFGSSGTVTFNGTPASPTSYTSTGITVPVPSGATTGPVIVKVGTISSNPVNFTVTTLPQIVATASPAPNANGWNNTNVTVTFTCAAGSNPIQTCPAPIIVTTEGKNQVVTGTVTDTGGQTASASVTVSIDKTPPTITAVPSPAPNANGWNNTSVTVSFTTSDALSGVASCDPPVTVTAQGTTVVSGTVTDKAGNTATATITVKIDKTAPTITAVVTPTPVNGINTGPVTITFTCTDALSGIATCPAPISVTTTGGVAKSYSGTAVDVAGNSATATVTVNIQPAATPPTITAVASPASNANGWNNSNVTVTFTCTAGSNAIKTCTSPVVVSTEGANQVVSGTATDTAGLMATTSVTVSLDKTPPVITAVQSPAANANGWNNSNVTVTFTCSDALSGIAGTCPAPITVATEGTTPVTGSVTDKAGNTASATLSVKIDKTPPAITAVAAPAPNANGWNNSNVTVTFTCSDSGSGIATCPAPITVSTEAANQTVSGTATDKAGNTATANVIVNLDKTPPTITAAVTPAPVSGIYYGSATVTFTCADSLSGIATCTSPISVTTFGANQSFTGTAVDKAGNTATTTVTINVQPAVSPTITPAPSPAPNANGWNNTNVTVSFTCAAGSYPIQTCPSAIVDSTEGANQSVCGTVTDTSGKTATACVVLNIDKTLPVITASPSPLPNAAGWNKSPVTVTFTCSDALSGATGNPSPFTDSTEGTTPVTASCTDKAGNTSSTTLTIKIDLTPPTISAAASPAPNANGWNNSNVTVTFICADSGSGISICPSPVTVSTEAANQTVTGTATDVAGNTASASVSVSLDKTPPTITATVTPTPVNGINTGPVTVTFACSDSLSGVATCPAAVNVATTPSGPVTVSGTAIDKAGNQASASAVINIQSPSTPPTIVASATPSPNAAGWNNTNVTVSFTCTAGSSPIQTCPSPIVVSTEGANQSVCGTVTDTAGKTATACVVLSIDKTPPVLTAVASPAPNAAGWNKGPVTVTFTCTDALSGVIGSPAPATVTTEGVTPVTASCSDKAGNTATTTLTVKIDQTPPTITASISPPPNANGWNMTSATVTFTCADSGSGIASCTPPVTINTEGAGQQVTGTATDVAGNAVTKTVIVNLSKTLPTITAVVTPSPNAAGWNTSPVTITFTCSAGGAPLVSCPPAQTVSTEGANQSITATVTDVSGASATATAKVSLDFTPPVITATPSPSPNANGYYTSNVTVTFTCTDALSGIAVCPSPVTVTTDGVGQVVNGTAVDVAGNSAVASITLNIEKAPITITAAVSPQPNAAGWNNSPVTITYTCAGSPTAAANCPPPKTVSTEGAGQVITATVTDAAGNQATTTVTLNIDLTPPTILQLVTPSQLASTASSVVTLTATDNIAIASVIFSVNGTPVATLFSAPYQFTLTVPSTANVGDTLNVTAAVTDLAGNTSSASRGVSVVANGVLVGQVLSDLTGLPQPNAIVQVVGASLQTTSDASGRYTIPVSSSQLFLQITAPADPIAQTPASITVERQVAVQSGVGTVPVDARLTPIAPAVSIDATGGTLTAGTVTVTVPANSVPAATPFYLTALSAQGLPGLLPLGWSPVVAFDLSAGAQTSAQFTTNFTKLPQNQSLQLVTYNTGIHAWTVVTPSLTSTDGTLPVLLPATGCFALVVADTTIPPITVPAVGQPLTGTTMVLLPPDATSAGSLNPASIPPTGGTAMATLPVLSSVPLPSGTVIQSNLTENYTLVTGDILADQARSEDIVLFDFLAPPGAAAVAMFPVAPSHTFQISALKSGKVHLDILAGREGVRGDTGGNTAVVVQSGDATLAVAAGSLTQNTAINVTPETIATYLPSVNGLTPLSQYVLDFSDQILSAPAQLSVSAGSAQPGDTLLIALIQRFNGVPRLVVVSLAQINGNQMVSQPYPGLPGIIQGGEYVFYQSVQPIGFVAGTVSANSAPVSALVQSDMLPFVTVSATNGLFTLPAVAGAANLTASVPLTALVGTGSVSVQALQTASLNLTLTGAIESATVTPPDGTVGASLTPEVDVVAPDAFNVSTITTSSVQLFQVGGTSGNQPVAIRFVFSQGGKQLAVFPVSGLQPSTKYTFSASGLANVLSGLVAVPTVSFTTQANTPATFNPNALVFGMPDQNGNVSVTAPAGSFPPASTILIVDQTNGVVLSLTVFNDGSVTGQLPATINDTLVVTITAPDKTTATFTTSTFVAPDGTTAIGPGGGTVVGPGNTGLIIPQGALAQGVTFKLTPLDQTAFPVLPTWQGSNFGSGLHVDAPAMPAFSQEVKLAFPVPAGAPQNAFYYVYRRLTDQDGNVYFDTIDHAFVQGTGATAQVVTASPPFCGYRNSYGALQQNGGILNAVFTVFQDFILMFDIPNIDPNEPGVASQGLIVGKALQTVLPKPGQTEITFPPIGGATVSLDSDTHKVATTDATCGTFALFDPQFGGGLRHVTISNNGLQLKAVVNEVNAQADASAQDATFGIFGVTAGLEAQYRNIGTVNFTFPPPPIVIPPQINIGVYTLDGNNQRQPIKGIVLSGTPLVVTFAYSPMLTLKGAVISGTNYAVGSDTSMAFTDGLSHSMLTNGYTSGVPGVYSIVATAQDPLNPQTIVTESKNFLVVTPGNGQLTATLGSAPLVINTNPLKNAVNVPTSIFPQINFSEPVTNVAGNVSLVGSRTGDSPALFLIGVGANGNIVNGVGPGDAITSLTIQPLSGLQFNEQYTLTLASGIVDQNTPPLPLATYTMTFTTSGGEEIGGTPPNDSFEATRPVVIGNRAYLGVYVSPSLAGVDVVDISDPTLPKDKMIQATFIGRAMDAAGQASSPVSRCRSVTPGVSCTPVGGGPLLAVAAGQPGIEQILPSNVYIYDVSNADLPNRVAAVSVTTSSTQDGEVLRLFMKDQFLYTSTFLKGLQVVDLQQASDDYIQGYGSNPTQFAQQLTTEGQGFANDAVVNTIPLPVPDCMPNSQPCQPLLDTKGNPQTFNGTMYDLKAGDFATSNSTQTLLVATGVLPLAVADPLGSGLSAVFFPPLINNYLDPSPLQFQHQNSDGTTSPIVLQQGHAVALGTFSTTDSQGNSVPKQMAILAGTGTAPPLPDGTSAAGILMVVDMTDQHHPAVIGAVQLTNFPVDLVLNGSIALIGTGAGKVLLVNLADPTHPIAAGEIDGPTLGDHLALTNSGIIISSSPTPTLGGVHTARLGSECKDLRNNLQNYGPTLDSVAYPLKGLNWIIGNGSYSPSGGLRDGFVLTGLQLGDRMMSNRISLPYLILTRTPQGATAPTTLQCSVSSDSTVPACDASSTSRSQLLQFSYTTPNGDYFALEAKYLLDRLDGDPEAAPVPDSCAVITQRYEFWREGYDAPEASDELSGARFKPMVTYQYFTDQNGPALQSFNTAQRFQNAPTQFQYDPSTNPPNFSYPSSQFEVAAFFSDCEPSDAITHAIECSDAINNYKHAGTTTFGLNPIPLETIYRVITGGQMALIPPNNIHFDNLHLRSYLGATPDIEGPTAFGHPGCPECVHTHWRWGSLLERDKFPGALVVAPNFDNNSGNPIIPPGSNQDVDVGILVANIGAGNGSEEHPNFGQKFSDFANPPKPTSTLEPLSFWYSGTGHSSQDTFMMHGFFFSSMRVTIGIPYIYDTVLGILDPIPVQSIVACPLLVQLVGACPVSDDIFNRSGHQIQWTATLLDTNTRQPVAPSTTGLIAGTPGLEIPGTAIVYFPPNFVSTPTYILDIKIVDLQDPAGWSTERLAYLTEGAPIP